MGSTICFKREVFDNIKFKDISIREDYNFNSECLKYGYMLYSTSSYNHLVFKHADISKHTFKSNINMLINKCIEIKSNIEFTLLIPLFFNLYYIFVFQYSLLIIFIALIILSLVYD